MGRHDAVHVVPACKATVRAAVAAFLTCSVHSVQILPKQTAPSRTASRPAGICSCSAKSTQCIPHCFSVRASSIVLRPAFLQGLCTSPQDETNKIAWLLWNQTAPFHVVHNDMSLVDRHDATCGVILMSIV